MDVRAAILPVLDIQAGQVVQGVAGERAAYRAVQSQLVSSSQPRDVARSLLEVSGSRDLYVADLDALSGKSPQQAAVRALCGVGATLWLDAGIVNAAEGHRLLDAHPCLRWIVCLEALPELDDFAERVPAGLADRCVFSLDLRHGVPWNNNPAVATLRPETIAERVIAAGVRTLIVLDVASVGTSKGPQTLELCNQLKARFDSIALVSGGGVRTADDVQRFVDAGCERVLVATALHQRTLGL